MSSRRPLGKFSLGVILVVGSAAGVVALVSDASKSTEVLVASVSIAPGEEISRSNVEVQRVPVSPLWGDFASPAELNAGLSATETIDEGSVLPLGSLDTDVVSDDSVVTLSLSVGDPQWLTIGSLVEVWVAPPGDENSFEVPFVVAPQAVIIDVRLEEGFAADSSASTVDVSVPRRTLPGIVHALANDFFLYLTPIPGGQ